MTRRRAALVFSLLLLCTPVTADEPASPGSASADGIQILEVGSEVQAFEQEGQRRLGVLVTWKNAGTEPLARVSIGCRLEHPPGGAEGGLLLWANGGSAEPGEVRTTLVHADVPADTTAWKGRRFATRCGGRGAHRADVATRGAGQLAFTPESVLQTSLRLPARYGRTAEVGVLENPALTTSPVPRRPIAAQCVPRCNARECGPDGCGGSCGECRFFETCSDASCVCTPSCGDATCGPDGCGGVCGECSGDLPVCSNGECAPAGSSGGLNLSTTGGG